MTTANKLTIMRIALIPVFLVVLYLDFAGARWWALGIFIVACLTDFVDGYIARHYNQITNFGKFMDPLADKMLVMAAMCYFVEYGQMPGWCLAIVLLREFAVSGMRLVAVEQAGASARRVVGQGEDRLDHGVPVPDAGVPEQPFECRVHRGHRGDDRVLRH